MARARAHVGPEVRLAGPGRRAAGRRRFYCTELAVDAYGGREQRLEAGADHLPGRHGGAGHACCSTPGRATAARVARAALRAPAARRARRRLRGRGRARSLPRRQPDEDGIAWLKSHRASRRSSTCATSTATPKASASRRPACATSASRSSPATRPSPSRCALPRARARPGAAARLRPLPARRRSHRRDDRVYRMEEQGWTNAEAFAEMEYFDAHASGATCATSSAPTARSGGRAARTAALIARRRRLLKVRRQRDARNTCPAAAVPITEPVGDAGSTKVTMRLVVSSVVPISVMFAPLANAVSPLKSTAGERLNVAFRTQVKVSLTSSSFHFSMPWNVALPSSEMYRVSNPARSGSRSKNANENGLALATGSPGRSCSHLTGGRRQAAAHREHAEEAARRRRGVELPAEDVQPARVVGLGLRGHGDLHGSW